MQNQPVSQLVLDSAIAQSEVWSQQIAQRRRLHFLPDLWSHSEFRTQRKTDPKSELTHCIVNLQK